MTGLLTLLRRLARGIIGPEMWPAVDEEVSEEIARRRASGASPALTHLWGAAQYLAIAVRIGPARGLDLVATVRGGWQLDLRQAVRGIRTRPGTAGVVVLTVAAAVGASTVVFSIFDTVLLRPLPYPEQERLVRLWQTTADWSDDPSAVFRSPENRLTPIAPTVEEWSRAELGFRSVGAWVDAEFVLQHADRAESIRGQEVSAGLFETLGVPPELGRLTTAADDVDGAAPVVLLSASFWRSAFGGDPAVVGSDLVLGGRPHEVIGVLPEHFRPPPASGGFSAHAIDAPRVWIPLSREARRGWKNVAVVARLDDGVSVGVASDRLSAFQDGRPALWSDYRGAWAEGFLESIVGPSRATLWFLMAAVGLVLLVACVNIVNMLMASGVSRRAEMALRAALGAARGRIAAGLLLETAALVLVGAAGALVVVWAGMPIVGRLLPVSLPRASEVGVHPGVLLFGIGLTGLVTLAVGVVPALFTTANVHSPLRAARSGSGAFSRLREGMAVLQLTLAFVLLVGAGLLARSYLGLVSTDSGFDPTSLVYARVVPDRQSYPTGEAGDAFGRELTGALHARGIRAAVTNHFPLAGGGSRTLVIADRTGGPPARDEDAFLTVSGAEFFDVVGIPLVSGRIFDSRDEATSQAVAIVSREAERRFWPGQSALGQSVRIDDTTRVRTVVGVVGDVRHRSLEGPFEPAIYLPAAQSARSTHVVALRSGAGGASPMRLLEDAVREVSPATPVRRVLRLEDAVADLVEIPRFRTRLVVAMAALAAGLALGGVFGVSAFAVARARREIGIRVALGSDPRGEVRRVVLRGLAFSAMGIVAGSLLALAVGELTAPFLHELEPTDPLTYLLVALLLGGVSGLAAYLPARSAGSVDPARVLREEG